MKYGRVRDEITDPDVEVKLKAEIEEEEILNLHVILLDRYQNKACHGDGRLVASIVRDVNFDNAFNRAKAMQNREAIYYGPLTWKGTNCSRFVAKVVLGSSKNWMNKMLIMFPYTVSATPKSNAKVLNDLPFYYEVKNGKINKKKSEFYFFKKWFITKRVVKRKKIINTMKKQQT